MKQHLMTAAAAVLLASAAAAAPVPVYSSIPSPLPGSVPSLGYEATSTDESGDHVILDSGGRKLSLVRISLNSWACENDYTLSGSTWTPDRAGDEACVTTPGSGFNHPITVNIYSLDTSGVTPMILAPIATKTQNVSVPFRPSHDPANCPDFLTDIPFGGTWYSAGDDSCFHGYAFTADFDFTSAALTLPDEVLVTVAYNTADYGAVPLHAPGPYNSLNFSYPDGPPSIGADAEPGTVWVDTSWSGFYCDGGAAGVGILRRDFPSDIAFPGCTWDPLVPAFTVFIAPKAVGIDLRPNNQQNQVNTGAKQLVPIAILGAAGFDPVVDVDVESVTCRGASPVGTKFDRTDVNGDGLRDLTLYFRARSLQSPSAVECQDPAAMLTLEGNLISTGEAFEGSDHVTWLGC